MQLAGRVSPSLEPYLTFLGQGARSALWIHAGKGSGAEGGIRLNQFHNYLMARDFRQQVVQPQHLLASPRESSPVLETFWRRQEG